jgi:hypothetical protein
MKNTNKMDYLSHLKRNKLHSSSRFIVKYDGDLVREVKLIFNPEEYRKGLKPRKLYTQKGIIKILENDKQKRNT